jgi:hypothetical protein
MSFSAEDTFNLEVLKLLLTLAWVDGEVEQHEAQMVMGLGRSWGVPEMSLRALMDDVKAGKRPGEPDYALLKTRADEAITAARALVLSDGKIAPEESALLKRVVAALS